MCFCCSRNGWKMTVNAANHAIEKKPPSWIQHMTNKGLGTSVWLVSSQFALIALNVALCTNHQTQLRIQMTRSVSRLKTRDLDA